MFGFGQCLFMTLFWPLGTPLVFLTAAKGELVLGRGVKQHLPHEVDPPQLEARRQGRLPVREGARGDVLRQLLPAFEN